LKKFVVAAIIAAMFVAQPVEAAASRSAAVIKEFKEQSVCPSTGFKAVKGKSSSYRCPGYVVDHMIPRCAGGPDELYNLVYQKYDKENSLKKDTAEKRLCSMMKKAGIQFQELDEED
jgi:hypothetical protein